MYDFHEEYDPHPIIYLNEIYTNQNHLRKCVLQDFMGQGKLKIPVGKCSRRMMVLPNIILLNTLSLFFNQNVAAITIKK